MTKQDISPSDYPEVIQGQRAYIAELHEHIHALETSAEGWVLAALGVACGLVGRQRSDLLERLAHDPEFAGATARMVVVAQAYTGGRAEMMAALLDLVCAGTEEQP